MMELIKGINEINVEELKIDDLKALDAETDANIKKYRELAWGRHFTLLDADAEKVWNAYNELSLKIWHELKARENGKQEPKEVVIEVQERSLVEIFDSVLGMKLNEVEERKNNLVAVQAAINKALRNKEIDEQDGYKQLKCVVDEIEILNKRILKNNSWKQIQQEVAKKIAEEAWKNAARNFGIKFQKALFNKIRQEQNNMLQSLISRDIKGENKMEKLKVFEAFAGVGAQRMALRNLGIPHEVVGIAEIDKHALASYKAIHDELPNFGDISKIDPNTLPDMDLFTYSFPCQDLSVAGKGAGLAKGTRSGLLYECEKVIETKRPKYLLLENVKNLVGKKFKADFDKWLEYLEGLGYRNYWQVLNAKNYGRPQNRERVFVISILDEDKPFEFPMEIPQETCLADFLETEVDKKYYSDKRFELVDKTTVKAEFTDLKFEQSKRIYGTDGVFKCLCTKGENNILMQNKINYIAQFPTISYRNNKWIIGVDGIARCLMTGYGNNNVLTDEPKDTITKPEDNYSVRRLTPLECWRLMGFTDEDYKKAAQVTSENQLYKQAGNSIVVQVLEEIFRNLFL